jgi:hypothetical protein
MSLTNDDQGNVFVENGFGQTIYECTADGQVSALRTDKKVGALEGIAYHEGDLYLASFGSRKILKLTPPKD